MGHPVRSQTSNLPEQVPLNLMHTFYQHNNEPQSSKKPHENLRNELTALSQTKSLQPSSSLNFEGRRLSNVEPEAVPVLEHASPNRHLTPRNQIVGGVFLHHTRLKEALLCSGRFPQKLAHSCRNAGTSGKVIQSEHPPS